MTMKTRLLASTFAAGLAMTATPSLASDAGEIVVVATGAAQDSDTIGQAVTVIDRATIEQRQSISLLDILTTTPGVTYTRNGGPGGMAALRIRGAEDSHTLTLVDGVRINDPTSTGGAYDFGNLLSLVVDRVEVLRGPNSVPWGSDAIGGVVNIVTATPTEGLAARASAEYGHNDAVSLASHISGAAGPVSASLGAGYFRDEGISAFRFGTELDGYRQYVLSGRLGVALGEDAGLDLRTYYADSKRDLDGFPPPFFSFDDTADHAAIKELTAYAGAHATLLDGALRNRIAYTHTNIVRHNVDAFGDTPFRGVIQRVEYRGDADIMTGVRALFGAEHVFSRATDDGGRRSTRSDSGHAQIVLTPVESLTLTGGIRVDDHRAYGTKTTFGANAAWRPLTGTIVRANYAEGFKAPTLYQLFSVFGFEGLQPETARNYEVGVEQQLVGGQMVLGLTAFQRDTVNLIDFQFCSVGDPLCASGRFGYYFNLGRARARGIEATLLFKPTDRLTMDASYSYVDSENRITGERLVRRPAHSVTASLDWEAVRDVLSVGATVKTVSESEDFHYLTFARTRLDGYTVVDLRASVAVNAHLELYGRVENLFDESYETVSGYGTVGRAAFIGVRAKL